MTDPSLPDRYRAFHVSLEGDTPHRSVRRLDSAALPDHDVTVRVAYSSLNYKDGLSAAGNRGVTKNYPHTPGIDAAGTVVMSRDPRFAVGAEVLCTGYDLGMNTPGGFGEMIRVPGDWLVPLPEGLDARGAMIFGTAGFTAAMAVAALQRWGVSPALGPIVVTGASGGVGTLSIFLLARAGFAVTASTGTSQAHDLLSRLGASAIIPRQELATDDGRALAKARFGGGIDTVGGSTLASLVKQSAIGGAVAACGNVGGADVALNVYPFILRGVALLGIDSQHLPMPQRQDIWQELAAAWRDGTLGAVAGLVREVDLDGLDGAVEDLLAGKTIGRVLVRLAG